MSSSFVVAPTGVTESDDPASKEVITMLLPKQIKMISMKAATKQGRQCNDNIQSTPRGYHDKFSAMCTCYVPFDRGIAGAPNSNLEIFL